MEAGDACSNPDYRSIRKPGRVTGRQEPRQAVLAFADLVSSLAGSMADFWASMAEGVATGLQTVREQIDPKGGERAAQSPANHAEVFAATARYFDEMARLASQTETANRAAEAIDYDRLAKEVAAEILRVQAEARKTPAA